ncbi:MAG: LysR substrate-binding domain-containing protein [Aquificaceae bacterium]
MKPIDVDLRLLEIFCCVYEKGSLSESTNCLHLSQSTISFHIHNLENSIGLKLFYKKGRKYLPTSSAHMLYPYAKKLLELKLSVIEEIKLITKAYKGYIRIGASSIPGRYMLPEIIGEYLSKNTNTRIELMIGDSQTILRRLESGEVDLGFISFRCSKPHLEAREVWEDRVLFLGGPGIQEELTLEELLKLPFIIGEDDSEARKFIENFLESIGVDLKSLNIILVVNNDEILLDVLSRTKAVSYVSSCVLNKFKIPAVKVLRALGITPPPIRKFYLTYNRERPHSPAVADFLHKLHEFFEYTKARSLA